jgi:hypothetical protein
VYPQEARLLLLFDESQQKQQHDGTDRCDNKTAEETTSWEKPESAKEETAEQCTDHPDNDVADDAEAAAPHQLSRQPSRGETYQDKPKEFHYTILLIGLDILLPKGLIQLYHAPKKCQMTSWEAVAAILALKKGTATASGGRTRRTFASSLAFDGLSEIIKGKSTLSVNTGRVR